MFFIEIAITIKSILFVVFSFLSVAIINCVASSEFPIMISTYNLNIHLTNLYI